MVLALIEDTLAGWAKVIVAIAILVAVSAAALLVWRRGFSRVDAKFGSAAVSLVAVNRKLDQIAKTTDKVNNAVNNVPAGSPTLVDRVGSLEASHRTLIDHQRWSTTAMHTIATNVGATLTESPLERSDAAAARWP